MTPVSEMFRAGTEKMREVVLDLQPLSLEDRRGNKSPVRARVFFLGSGFHDLGMLEAHRCAPRRVKGQGRHPVR